LCPISRRLAVEETGNLVSVEKAQTLTEAQRRANELRIDLELRKVHPDVLRFCTEELLRDNYFHAVLEATKSVADRLRARSGLTDDGAALVNRTLSGDLARTTAKSCAKFWMRSRRGSARPGRLRFMARPPLASSSTFYHKRQRERPSRPGWTSLPASPLYPHDEPMCADAVFFKWSQRSVAGEQARNRHAETGAGIGYAGNTIA
jgi:Protein of unknown function (Hypoth_ymh)